jgi:hypothetical protein
MLMLEKPGPSPALNRRSERARRPLAQVGVRRALAGLVLCLVMPGVAPALADDGEGFVLFRDFYGTLTRSSLDGRSGQELAITGLPNVPLGNYFQPLDAGRKFAIFMPKSKDLETVSIHDASTARLLFSQDIPVGTDITGPLFGDADKYLLRTTVGSSDGNQAFIVNLRTGTLLGRVSTQGVKDDIRALPDGRLYKINGQTGRIMTAGADGQWRDLGALQVPVGMRIGVWTVSHRGDRIAIVYTRFDKSNFDWSDVWVANLDGSGQYRVTQQGLFNYPLWSPDDSHLSVRMDTMGSLTTLGRVRGDCGNWQLPAQARDVTGLQFGVPHPVAREILVSTGGRPTMTRICKIAAWVR